MRCIDMSDWFLLREPRHSWECRRSHRQLVSQWRAGPWGSLHHGSPVGANWIQLAHCNALQHALHISSPSSPCQHVWTIFMRRDAARLSISFCPLGVTKRLVTLSHASFMQVKNVTFQWTLWGTSSSVRKLFVSTLCWYKLPWYKLGYCFYSEIFHLGQRTYAINKSCVEFCIRILPAFLRELRMFWSYRTWSYTVSLSLHGPTCGRRTKL